MSFFDILFFTILNPVINIIVAIIAPINIVFNGYVPKNNPFFINISCGFITYINANATPPNRNEVK